MAIADPQSLLININLFSLSSFLRFSRFPRCSRFSRFLKFSRFSRDFPDFPKDSWDDGIQINLSSFYQICELITPHMKKSGTGKIIAVSSMYGVVAPSPALYNGQNFHCPAVYSASKAGLIGLVRWLASYLGEDNINVNCISPGGVFNNQDTEFVEKLKEKIPLKRMATKNDINGIVKFLLSDDSSYAQGHNFIIDGGYTIR